MKIRKANATDVRALSQCVDNAYQHYIERLGKPPGPMLDDYEQIIASQIVYVADFENNIAGIVVLIPTRDPILLDNLAVDPGYQNKGIGNALLIFAENMASDLGHKTIQLYTHELMHENVSYYQSKGYTISHRIKEKGYQRIYMSKEL